MRKQVSREKTLRDMCKAARREAKIAAKRLTKTKQDRINIARQQSGGQ